GECLVGALDERPAWVGLEVTEAGQAREPAAQAVAGGFFFVPPATVPAAGEVRAGLDFGTSNTCVAFQGQMISDDQSPALLPKVDEQDWNLYLVRGGPELRTHRGPDLWPSPSGFGAKGDLFASELLFGRAKADQTRALDAIDA